MEKSFIRFIQQPFDFSVMQFVPLQKYITISVLLVALACLSVVSLGAASRWNGSVDCNWGTAANWNCYNPSSGLEFMCDPVGNSNITCIPNVTIQNRFRIDAANVCGSYYTFNGGGSEILMTDCSNFLPRSGNIVFNCLSLRGESGGCINFGDGCRTLNFTMNGGRLKAGTCPSCRGDIQLGKGGPNSCNYLTFNCVILDAWEIDIGSGNDVRSCVHLCNSQYLTQSDFDIGHDATNHGTLTLTSSTMRINTLCGNCGDGEFIISHENGGHGTIFFECGSDIDVTKFRLISWKNGNRHCCGSGFMSLASGSCFQIHCSSNRQNIGCFDPCCGSKTCKPAEMHVMSEATMNFFCEEVQMSNVAVIQMCSATIGCERGGGHVRGGELLFRGNGVERATIRGGGVIHSDINMQGGVFGGGTTQEAGVCVIIDRDRSAGTPNGGADLVDVYNCLTLNGNITISAGNDAFNVEGGTLMPGPNASIGGVGGWTSATMDINLLGGSFHSGITRARGANEGNTVSLDTLTLSGDALIGLGTGVHEVSFANIIIPAGAVVSITGFEGAGLGVTGIEGRLYTNTNIAPAELAAMYFDGYGDGATLISGATGALGYLYEIVPTRVREVDPPLFGPFWRRGHACNPFLLLPPVPEPSTWLGGGSVVAYAFMHYVCRRQRKKKVLDTGCETGRS